MREIKFRAWDITNHRMYDRVLAGPGDPCSIVWDEERHEWVQFDDACGVIMQYTGLKEWRGNDIFEGDILLVEGFDIGVVEYGKACFFARTGNGDRVALEDTSIYLIEVIGNLYEHPELLGDRQQ